jgi:hypothetical protein
MLGAMMVGSAARYANSVNLLSAAPWTVPAGVTTIYINAATQGGPHYFLDTSGNRYVGGGGAGGYIVDAPISVTPGDILALTITAESTSGGTLYEVRRSGLLLFNIRRGQSADNAGNTFGNGGSGGTILWNVTAQTANGGTAGNTAGQAGGNGEIVAITGGGTLMSGGGGGAGGQVTPFIAGGAAGGVSVYAGSPGENGFGGAGGGYFNGNAQKTLSPSPTFVYGTVGADFITVNY